MKNLITIMTLLLGTFLFHGKAHAEDLVPQAAHRLVDQYIELDQQFDTSILKLYAPNAVLRIRRIAATGSNTKDQFIEKAFTQISEHFIDTMPQAEINSDHKAYSNIQFSWMQNRIKVSMDKYSSASQHVTPHVLVLAQSQQKEWKIIEEYAVTYAASQH